MEKKDIPLVPKIPDEIFVADEKSKLILFVGAGVSRLVGYPSWDKLAEKALDETNKSKLINYADKILLNQLSPRTKLSIVSDIWEGKGKRTKFAEILMPSDNKAQKSNIFKDICSIGIPIVTTNYDECLDIEVEPTEIINPLENQMMLDEIAPKRSRNIFWRREDLTIEKLKELGVVLHLHGSIKDRESMIITTREYLEHYRDEYVQTFLSELFDTSYTVLFIGYGLEEEEILEYVLRKGTNSEDGKLKKHYRLFPCCRHDVRLVQRLGQYYLNHCGVKLIEYRIDENGHHQLEEVVHDWANKLKKRAHEPTFIENIKIMDRVL